MWGVVIGKSKELMPSCGARLCRELDHGYHVSRNNESYWISEGLLGIGAKVYIGTPEYDRLHAMLIGTASNETIRDWIDRLIIRKAPVATLKEAIHDRIGESVAEGRADAKAELRAWLGSN